MTKRFYAACSILNSVCNNSNCFDLDTGFIKKLVRLADMLCKECDEDPTSPVFYVFPTVDMEDQVEELMNIVMDKLEGVTK